MRADFRSKRLPSRLPDKAGRCAGRRSATVPPAAAASASPVRRQILTMSKTRRVRLSPNTSLHSPRWRLALRIQVFEKTYFDLYFPAIGERCAIPTCIETNPFASPRGAARHRTRGPSGDQSVGCGGFRVPPPFILRSCPRATARNFQSGRFRGRAASRRTRRPWNDAVQMSLDRCRLVLFGDSGRDILRPADEDFGVAALDDRAFHQRWMRGHQRNRFRFGKAGLVGVGKSAPRCR